MRSMRCIGKNKVGRPMRSPSGSITWRMKSSNEFKSIPRNVTPDAFMETRDPHSFSLGSCRLTMTMELGSKDALASLPQAELCLLSNLVARCAHLQFCHSERSEESL